VFKGSNEVVYNISGLAWCYTLKVKKNLVHYDLHFVGKENLWSFFANQISQLYLVKKQQK